MSVFLLKLVLFALLGAFLALMLAKDARASQPDQPSDDSDAAYYFDPFRSTGLGREAAEWSLIAGMVIVDQVVLSDVQPWPDEPAMDTNYKYWSPGESRSSTVPMRWIQISGCALGASILLFPNNKGWMNHVTYRHFKGFVESTLALTPLLTSVAKLSFGKERPYYDQIRNEGREFKPNDRKSFWSGHASAAFSLATYFNLFLINNIGANSQKGTFFWKGALTLSTYGLATYVAATRVSDHKHDALDVTVGALVGTAVSLMIYGLHENWFGEYYEEEDPSPTTSKRQRDLFVSPYPGGLSLMKTF